MSMDNRRVSIGLDAGTQSVKCVICAHDEENGEVIALGQSNTLEVDYCNQPNFAEQAPHDWIHALQEAVSDALNTFTAEERRSVVRRIASIGVSGQQHGLVAIDAQGEVLRPCMLWCDTRATEEANYLSTIAKRSIPAGFTAPKILWLHRHEPSIYHSAAHFLLPHDFINYYLSGNRIIAMERGDASGTGLLDPSCNYWDTSLVTAIDGSLTTKLPAPLQNPHASTGTMDRRIARLLFGSNVSDDIMVAPGCGDNAMAYLGVSSAVSSDTSPLVVSLGTSGTIMLRCEHPIADADGMVSCFADATGSYLPLVCIQNCANIPSEIARSFCSAQQCLADVIADLTHEASNESVGCDGVTLLPYFSGGERTPNYPLASGALLGLRFGHLQRRGLLYRAALEGVTFALLRGYRRLQQLLVGQNIGQILLVGGGAANSLWRQIIADTFQLPVRLVDKRLSGHVGAIGAAFQAAATSEGKLVGSLQLDGGSCSNDVAVPTDDRAVMSLYEEAYHRHVQHSERVFG